MLHINWQIFRKFIWEYWLFWYFRLKLWQATDIITWNCQITTRNPHWFGKFLWFFLPANSFRHFSSGFFCLLCYNLITAPQAGQKRLKDLLCVTGFERICENENYQNSNRILSGTTTKHQHQNYFIVSLRTGDITHGIKKTGILLQLSPQLPHLSEQRRWLSLVSNGITNISQHTPRADKPSFICSFMFY